MPGQHKGASGNLPPQQDAKGYVRTPCSPPQRMGPAAALFDAGIEHRVVALNGFFSPLGALRLYFLAALVDGREQAQDSLEDGHGRLFAGTGTSLPVDVTSEVGQVFRFGQKFGPRGSECCRAPAGGGDYYRW